MKRFIVMLTALFCFSMAQDIAGSWNLTAVDVLYYNFVRPNTYNDASTGPDGSTVLYVHSTYPGLDASIPLTTMPAGYMFLEAINGPFGTAGLAGAGVSLNVTLFDDDPATPEDEAGTGLIPEGSSYPNIDLVDGTCTTAPSIDAVTDDIVYSSSKDDGAVLPAVNIAGKPSRNRYAGEAAGSMSLSQSVIFSYFPKGANAVNDDLPFPIFFVEDDGSVTYGATPTADGGWKTAGVTGGWIKTEFDPADGSIGDDGPGGHGAPNPDLALYWHSIDGYSAETGLGDILPGQDDPDTPDVDESDEDGDGTDFDRIFGLPAISATRISAAGAAALGYGSDINYLVAGDVSDGLYDLIYGGCEAQVAATVTGQCNDVWAGAMALCQYTFDPEGDPTGTVIGATGYTAEQCAAVLGSGAGQTVQYLAGQVLAEAAADAGAPDVGTYVNGACLTIAAENGIPESYAVAGFVTELCLGAGFSDSACGTDADDPDTDENEQGLANLVTVDYAVTDCAGLAAATPTLVAAAAGLVDTVDENEDGTNCDEWALSVADGFAAQSELTGNQTCTDLATSTVALTVEEVTTSDQQASPNMLYIMNPDPAYATWGNFVTFNAYASGVVGATLQGYLEAGGTDAAYIGALQAALAGFAVNDSDHDFDIASLQFIDTDGDQIPDTPYSATGGRLVLQFQDTCIPTLEAVEVQTEFTGTYFDAPCDPNGDLDLNGIVNVSDVVLTVAHILATSAEFSAEEAACRVDLNTNPGVDVGDIVLLVNIILGIDNNGRDKSTSLDFFRTGEGFKVGTEDALGAVEITLSHGDDFSIDHMTEALVADYSTDKNTTKLVVVSPESTLLFKATGEYVVEEIVAANLRGDLVDAEMPVSFNLGQAYPNPFNPSTTFDIELNYESNVSISVYNVMGQMVDVLYEGNMSAGMTPITWDAASMASGMYIVKANVGEDVLSQKIMLIK